MMDLKYLDKNQESIVEGPGKTASSVRIAIDLVLEAIENYLEN
jgi:hypothetical protein